jgi:hypothetical protein
MEWIYVDKYELDRREHEIRKLNIDNWRKISKHFPPSFYDVLVLLKGSKRGRKAYFDAPNQVWNDAKPSKNFWDKEVKNVIAWKEMSSNTFKMQREERDK